MELFLTGIEENPSCMWRILMFKMPKSLLLTLTASLFLAACAGGGGAEVTEPTGPVEPEVQPGMVEAKKDEAMASENENHELRKKIFEAKVKLGIPTNTEEESTEEAKGEAAAK